MGWTLKKMRRKKKVKGALLLSVSKVRKSSGRQNNKRPSFSHYFSTIEQLVYFLARFLVCMAVIIAIFTITRQHLNSEHHVYHKLKIFPLCHHKIKGIEWIIVRCFNHGSMFFFQILLVDLCYKTLKHLKITS